VLRRVRSPLWTSPDALSTAPDGSLFVRTADGVHLVADAAALARTARPLPPVASDCVSDQRVHPSTTGAAVTRLPATPGTWLDLHGTEVRTAAGLHGLVLHRAGGAVRYRTPRLVTDVVADGTGGAWWFEELPGPDTSGWVGHLDRTGRFRLIVRGAPLSISQGNVLGPALAPAPDGSLWWRNGHSAWHRTTRDGHTSQIGFDGGSLAFGGDTAFCYRAQYDTGPIAAVRDGSVGHTVLGAPGGLLLGLPSAAASHATALDTSAEGSFAVSPRGTLLLFSGGWLAEFPSGGGSPRLLAGPQDGLPPDGELTVLDGSALVRGVRRDWVVAL
jgi:hypothetical protein